MPREPGWEDVEVEPTHRARLVPGKGLVRESRLTIPQEWMEQLWQGYRCAACLERLTEAFPEHCPNSWCYFPIRERQRQRLEEDFVEQVEQMRRDGFIDRELATLERSQHIPKPQIHVRRDL